ncbi:MAG: porin [Burkholderiales bacterium]|nr:porin [Burkholderiales bacterium]
MNKKLLVLALAAGFAAPAMADVTISGTVNAGVNIGRSNDGSGAGSNPSTGGAFQNQYGVQGGSGHGLTSNYSNINIRSEEDIGNGNKVIFNYQVDISNTGAGVHTAGSSALRSRNSYLGLMGGWGALKWGSNEHVYEQYMYQSDPLDGAMGLGGNLQMLGTPGGNVFAAANNGIGGGPGSAQFYRRTENSVWYESPDINGFTFAIAYGMPGGLQTYGATPGSKPTVFSAGAQYKPADMPFFVNIAVERHNDYNGLSQITGSWQTNAAGAPLSGVQAGTSNTKDTGVQIGGGVYFGDLTLYGRFERLTYKADGVTQGFSEWERDAFSIGAKYVVPTGYIGAQFILARDADTKTAGTETFGGKDTGATMFSLGYAHNLSKQTQALIFASFIQNDANANYLNIGSPTNGRGADGQSIYLGLKHSF